MQRSTTSLSAHPPSTAPTNAGTSGSGDNSTEHSQPATDVRSTPSEMAKPKKRCLRLDLRHSRDLFITMFYRIWMYRKRHLMITLLQLLIPPLILVGMTAYLGTLLEPEQRQRTDYKALDENDLLAGICGSDACTSSRKGVIAYYFKNNNKFANMLTQELQQKLAPVNIDLLQVGEKDDLIKEAIRYYLKGDKEIFIAGIEIDNERQAPGTYGLGKQFALSFTVSMAHTVPGFAFRSAPVFFDLSRYDPQLYYQLLGVEFAVCRAFYHLAKKTSMQATPPPINVKPPISIQVQSLSYPKHMAYTLKSHDHDKDEDGDGVKDKIADDLEGDPNEFEGIDSMLATIFVLSMVPVFFTVVEAPVTEKEDGFKLYLQLMGFPRGAYWFHWILNQMLIQFIVISLQVWLIFIAFDTHTGALVKYGDPSLWFVVLLLYNFASLSFFTFFASFCRRGKMATYIAILIWLISFQMLQSHVFDYGSSFSLFMISCMIPSGCIHWAVYILTTVNSVTWDISLNFLLTQKSGFRLADVMIMLVLNFFIYFLLTLYVDNLNPGPMELGQPWNYFFESLRCRFIDPNKDKDPQTYPSGTNIRRWRKCSKDHHHTHVCVPTIEVKKLSKKFYLIDGVFGIENVQFKAYSGAITVLLGHKDSGRTTIMRLLCGAYAPTSGTVIVFDYNVRRHTQKVQSFLSVCMENNMLCHYLTVMEHMQLIAKLKGVSTKDAKEDAKIILESLGLLSQCNDPLWRLANWQRRVLCVAMALIGEAPILLLDEPTYGLDLDAKRQIWALLKELRMEGKTILITTQDIDEAYELADKIVLMTRGRVAGVGAPAKLESILETGYHLYLDTIPDAKSDEILNFLREHVSTAKEREGSLKRMKKAIQIENWDQQSQAALVSLRQRVSKSKTVINIQGRSSDQRSSASKARNSELFSHMKPRLSTAVVGMNQDAKEPPAPFLQITYLLPATERGNFPSLFRAMEDGQIALKLGIKAYEFKWHSIETAFDEIDDYVDVLDATGYDHDLDIEGIEESKTEGLKLLIEEPIHEPMPEHKFTRDRKCCDCWLGLWALIIKRMYHAVGNYRHALCMGLLPMAILLIAISSTNVHFNRELLSPQIIYNTSTELISPRLPYRFKRNAGKEANAFLNSFKTVAGQKPNHITEFDNLGEEEFHKHYNEDNLYKLHDEVVIAADFTQLEDNPSTKKVVTALFSPGHHHSAPLSLLLMFNSMLHYEFNDLGYEYKISMTGRSMLHRKQLKYLDKLELTKMITETGADITLTVALAFGFFIFTAGFVTQACSERLCKLKRYQMYNLEWNGLYWLANALVDAMFNLGFTTLMTLIVVYAPDHEIFKNPQFIILFVITGTVGGFASILGSYYWSHWWLKKATAYYATLSVYQFFGLFAFLFYTIINFEYLQIPYLNSIVAHTLEIIQAFTIPWNFHAAIIWALENGRCRALHDVVKGEICSDISGTIKKQKLQDLRKECCSGEHGNWSLGFVFDEYNAITTPLWSNMAFLFFHCVLGTVLLMVKESRRLRRNFLYMMNEPEKPPAIINPNDMTSINYEEKFVNEEVQEMDAEKRKHLFLVENLSTSSGNRNLLHPMTFAVEPGKCTVIAGPETSGITSLYEILAGLRAISEGSVSYGGNLLFAWGTRRKFLQQLGLSPSKDNTLDKLSGYQLLALFARLRGIPSKELKHHINYWVHRLSLQQKIKKHCESYSSAFKKKLSIACAVIGNPSVLIFDEPTRDLDPLSKNEIHQVITSLICANRVVIILTHDLASVQNLCSKLIILVNGQMQFCEKIENIDEEIAEEFTLIIKLKGDDTGKIDFKAFTAFVSELEEEIDSMTLQDETSHMLIYRIKNSKYNWANLFETVEKVVVKHQGIVLDYNIRKTSLADVYHAYAVKQRVFRTTVSAWEEFRTTYC